jgi:tetratricopeptide (TPR) repeat protein
MSKPPIPAPVIAPRHTRANLIVSLLLVLATVATYWQVAGLDFINFDDPDYVTANPRVQTGLTAENLHWAFTSYHSSNWHPLTWISHMLDWQLFGANASGHHLVNLAIHVINVLLLFATLKTFTGALWRSAMVAALFALHPLHVESVAWVSERKDVLATCFGLLTLIAYGGYCRSTATTRARACYTAALLCFALGLMCKPMLVTWPFVLLLLDFWPLGRIPTRNGRWKMEDGKTLLTIAVEKLPFFGLTLAAIVVTLAVQGDSGATVPLSALPLEMRLAQMPIAYLRYLGKTFWPENLAVFYPYLNFSWGSPVVLGAAAVLIGLTVLVFWQRGPRPYVFSGWCLFLGTLVPVIGLVQVGRQAIADRYTYIPHIGLFAALVWLAEELATRFQLPKAVRVSVAVVLLAVLAVLTHRQLGFWKSTETLARHTIEATTGNYIAHAQLAGALEASGRTAEAMAECENSLKIRPDFAEAHNLMAGILTKQGKLDEAEARFRESARCDPNYPDPLCGLADLLIKRGRPAEAEQASRDALRIAPLHLGAMFTLAQALHNQNKLDEAVAAYQRLNSFKPDLFSGHRGLGSVLAMKGNTSAAIQEFQVAAQLQATNADVHNSLGVLLLNSDRKHEASNHFALAATYQPTNAMANYQLGLLAAGNREDVKAATFYQRALDAQPNELELLNNYAWLLATSPVDEVRNPGRAVTLAEHANQLVQERVPVVLGTLAAAYASAGKFDTAVTTATRARDLARQAGQEQVAQRNEELLKLYQSQKPYREGQP